MAAVVNKDSDTYRESQCVPGPDPEDIYQGGKYIFIANEATEIMRRNKKKVYYVFEDRKNEGSDVQIAASSAANQAQLNNNNKLIGSL